MIQPGNVVRLCTPEEVAAHVAEWLNAFGANRKSANAGDFLWHIFSGCRYPSISGPDAIAEYEKQQAVEYVVLSNDRKIAFVTDALPQRSSLSDYYVFPANLAWTMSFTHEDGWLGPYFARHSNFVTLNEYNLGMLRKRHQAEVARLKGWQ
jgi:hypothetical protein